MRVAGVPPFLPVFLPSQFIHFLIFCSFLLFPFILFLFALPIFFFCPSLPFPFYQNSHHSVSMPEVVRGDRNGVQFVPLILCYLYCLVEIFSGVLLYFVYFSLAEPIVVFPFCRR